MPNLNMERELLFVGGPYDGDRKWQPKAFWPIQNLFPGGADSPDVWARQGGRSADEWRYIPQTSCEGPTRMVWSRPAGG
ncbi:hypothetical protein AB0K21_21935 [Streptosporangium sp. NPDC049248]|uniref:hypothetical protein n=1 Tax=Streptosporangium sp. NPDC049248 TaxID=3155651 RepID=UPI003447ADBE